MAVGVDAVRALALSWPEAHEAPHFERTSFRVGTKIFATMPADGATLNVFIREEQRAPWLAAGSAAFAPVRWGGEVVGVEVDLRRAKPADVKALLGSAWRERAPRRLVAPRG